MKVELLHHNPDALTLLLRTKNTRLRHESDPSTWSEAERLEHLSYMRETIKSSWEFCEYVFEISGVTRAFTHQLVRTRNASYAQESQRTVDVRESEVLTPASLDTVPLLKGIWDAAVYRCKEVYMVMVDEGKLPVQDARGILPTNMTTSIIAKFTLRTLHEMAKIRLCVRTQGEYQDVFREMRQRVVEVHPWVAEHRFIEVSCVGDGICAFPRYGKKECKFYGDWMDRTPHQNILHKVFWAESKQVAVPVARGGKTM